MPLRRGRDALDAGGGAHPEGAAAGLVGVADPVEADDLAAGGQVGAGDEPHQVVEVGVGVGDQVTQRLHDLDQVVRGHVGRHADGDAGGAVDEQVGERGGQHRRLELAAVVVGLEVDGVLVDRGRHRHRRRRHPALGVPHRRRAVVGRAEVAVAVDQRQPHRPGLRHPDQRVVDRAVAVRVQPAHHLADDAGALHVPAVGPQAHVVHRVEDPALHRLEAVAGVGQGAAVDDRVGVLQEAGAHLVADVDVEDVLLEVVGRRGSACCARAMASFSPGWTAAPHGARRATERGTRSAARFGCCEHLRRPSRARPLPAALGGRRPAARRPGRAPAPDRHRGRASCSWSSTPRCPPSRSTCGSSRRCPSSPSRTSSGSPTWTTTTGSPSC